MGNIFLFKYINCFNQTPNTNHSGFYLAIDKGYYAEVGIELEILPPSQDYTNDETPARSVVNGRADLCIAPSESAISCWVFSLERHHYTMYYDSHFHST